MDGWQLGSGRLSTITPVRRPISVRAVPDHRAEAEVLAEWTGVLARRNQALDDFAALVAHELKDQLFASVTSGDLRAVARALDLVDELLEAARNEGRVGWADPSRALHDALADVPESPSRVESSLQSRFPLPHTLLRVVLRNLIANSAAAGAYVVTVSSASDGTSWALRVEDDGAGLGGPRHGGDGIGLRLCRRIAERRGGSLELDGSAFGGARATLTIPEVIR